MINTQLLLETYGYWALIVGTALEGETILILGGFAAHSGYLKLPLVILSAFTGSLVGDQFFFWMGRKRGKRFLEGRPGLLRKMDKAQRLLERHRTPVILGFRFLYGFRTVTPFLIGITGVSFFRFFILNAIGALIWACTVAGLGYFFGEAMSLLLGDIRRFEVVIAIALMLLGLILWLYLFIRSKRTALVKDELREEMRAEV
jgi:membrane protein DedA with SNARE-associated domain